MNTETTPIDEVELDKLAAKKQLEKYPYVPFNDEGYFRDMYKEGYKAAQDKGYSIDLLKIAFDLLERAYKFNKQDMGWDGDFEDFKTEYLNTIKK